MSCLAITAAVFDLRQWDLGGSWLGAPALVRVAGEFACGAFIRRSLNGDISSALPRWVSNSVGIAAAVLFLIGASFGAADFILVALLAAAILAASSAQSMFSRMLSGRPTIWLGEISYSIYMVHFPILIALHRVLNAAGFAQWNSFARVFSVAGAVTIVIGAAAVMFYVVESPVRTRLRNSLGLLSVSSEKRT